MTPASRPQASHHEDFQALLMGIAQRGCLHHALLQELIAASSDLCLAHRTFVGHISWGLNEDSPRGRSRTCGRHARASGYILALPSSGASQLLIRGAPANPDTFSLTTVQSRAERVKVESVRQTAYQACMTSYGFANPPGDDAAPKLAAAFTLAAIGDDGGQDLPAARKITIAPGVTQSLFTTWTPKSCTYRSFEAVGVAPFRFEATRQQMQALVYQGDQAAVADLGTLATAWGECVGNREADPQDLLNAVDGLPRGPYGGKAGSRLRADLKEKAMRIGAAAHMDVAVRNQGVVDAWSKLVDAENAAAGA